MRPSLTIRSALLVAAATWLPACAMLPALLGQSATVEEEGSGGGDSGDGGGGAGGGEEIPPCEVGVVDDPASCGEACDALIEGEDGRSMCTTACDVALQDCEGDHYRCEENAEGAGACFLDCAGSEPCPDDYACDQESELCIPVRAD